MRGFPRAELWRRKILGLIVCGEVVFGAYGCGVYQAGVRTGPYATQNLSPVEPSKVKFYGNESHPLEGEEIGFVIGISDLDEDWLVMQRVREAAAKLGADAIVDLRFEVVQSSRIVARGRAIRLAPVVPTMHSRSRSKEPVAGSLAEFSTQSMPATTARNPPIPNPTGLGADAQMGGKR